MEQLNTNPRFASWRLIRAVAMNAVACLAAAAGAQTEPISRDEAITRALAAAELMAGLDRGFTNFYSYRDRSRVDGGYNPEDKWYELGLGTFSATVNHDGRLRFFGVGKDWADEKRRKADPSPRISLDEAKRICTQLYHLSDDRFPLKFTEVNEWDEGFRLWAQPDVGPIPLWMTGECIFEVSRHRGLVFSAYMGYAPDLRHKDHPTVPREDARLAAFDAYARHKPFARARAWRTDLILHPPRFFPPREFTPELFELGLANIAIPMYVTFFGDETAHVRERGTYSRFQYVYVDARDGRAIAIMDGDTGALSSYIGTATDASAPLESWLWAKTAGTAQELAASFVPIAAPASPFEGKSVCFLSGDRFVSGHYEPRSRTLRVGEGAGAKWFRVFGPFSAALRKAAGVQVAPFGTVGAEPPGKR